MASGYPVATAAEKRGELAPTDLLFAGRLGMTQKNHVLCML